MNSLFAAIEQRPAATFAAFAALHVAVWTVLPAALYPNLPLDLIEALTYGREWQLGYDKLPPLPWWMVEIVYRLFGVDLAYYLLAQLVVVAAFAAVFALAQRLTGATGALAAMLILDGQHYFHYTAAKFNHDVIQLPFWALAGFAYCAALRDGRMRHWIVLGLALGGAFWAKYFVVVLVLPLVLFALIDRAARRCLATPGPYVAALMALAVAAPHLAWLVQNDFLPLQYAEMRARPSRGLVDHLLYPLEFVLGQLFFILPALAMAVPLVWPRGAAAAPAPIGDFDRRIVTLLAFGPAAAVVALSLLTGRGTIAMWGYPLWLFLGLWIVLCVAPALDRLRLGRFAVAWAAIFTLFAISFIAAYTVLPPYDHRYRAVFFPGDRLAAEIAARYRALTGRPLAYVIASMWTGGNIAHYAPEHPRVLIDGSPRRAPWIDLGDLRSKGAAVVWIGGPPRILPPAFRAIAMDAEIQVPFTLSDRRSQETIMVGWAVLYPRPTVAGP